MMLGMSAYGYVRVSRMDDEQQKYSPQVQEERIRLLAASAGDADGMVVLSDLDVSGKEVQRRPGYMRLVEAIDAGEATSVYAWDLSRLHRNRREAERFWDLVVERGTEVRFVDGLTVDPKSATGRMFLALFNAINAWISEVTSEKIRASLARRERETGERNGNRPYGAHPGEDPAAVLAAFERARSFDATARELNRAGVPSRMGRPWSGTTVGAVLRRLDPDRFPVRDVPGTRSGAGTFRLSRLLACGACGAFMTARRDKRSGNVVYECRAARTNPGAHRRAWVSEHVVMPAVVEAAAREWRIVTRRESRGSEADDRRAAELAAKRERILANFEDGLIDRSRRDRRLDEVAEEAGKLRGRRMVARVKSPPLLAATDGVEASPNPAVNAYLRTLFRRVVVESMTEPAKRGPSREPVRLAFEPLEPAA